MKHNRAVNNLIYLFQYLSTLFCISSMNYVMVYVYIYIGNKFMSGAGHQLTDRDISLHYISLHYALYTETEVV